MFALHLNLRNLPLFVDPDQVKISRSSSTTLVKYFVFQDIPTEMRTSFYQQLYLLQHHIMDQIYERLMTRIEPQDSLGNFLLAGLKLGQEAHRYRRLHSKDYHLFVSVQVKAPCC
jgi:hypothetical protein